MLKYKLKPVLISQQGTWKPFRELLDLGGAISFPIWRRMSNFPKLTEQHVVFFEGGTDVAANYYGAAQHRANQWPDRERDTFEQEVYQHAIKYGAKMIGICRGAQFLTVMNGGKLIQDVDGHGGSHMIKLLTGERVIATSTHHQMMFPFDIPKHRILAHAIPARSPIYEGLMDMKDKDKITCEPEIVWYPDSQSLCIQGHPEYVSYENAFAQTCRRLATELFHL